MPESSRGVLVVTDSTSDIPPAMASSLGIEIVPLSVRFGDESFLDRVEINQEQFLALLKSASELPKTSQPPTTAYESVFRAALDSGRDVVCITIASNLSGTFNSARLAADAVDSNRVTIIDSKTVSMALGWCAIEAANAANDGKNADQVTAAAMSALERVSLYAVLETLDYVLRGGRIGRASHLIGSLLSIKPILTLRDGEVTPLERVRTWRKAVGRLSEIARSRAPLSGLAVAHAGNRQDAERLADELSELVPTDRLIFSDVGPVIATYAGPGAVGVFLLAAEVESVVHMIE